MRRGLVVVAFATSLAAFPAWAGDASGGSHPGAAANPIEPGSSPADAENTGRNARDRNGDTLTPMDQSNAPSDLEITQAIRKALVAEDGLSMNGKNVKVITVDGVVTLRGPVESDAERARIEAVARGMSEVRRVDSQLEVDGSTATR